MDYFDAHPITGKEAAILMDYHPELSRFRSGGTDTSIVRRPQVEEFLQMWDVTGFTAPFDYTGWAVEMGIKLDNADEVIKFLVSAGKEDVRRLSTAVVRMGKYSEGYLDALWEKGFSQLFFEKLKEYN